MSEPGARGEVKTGKVSLQIITIKIIPTAITFLILGERAEREDNRVQRPMPGTLQN